MCAEQQVLFCLVYKAKVLFVPIKAVSNRLKSFLSSSIPYLKRDHLVINLDLSGRCGDGFALCKHSNDRILQYELLLSLSLSLCER